MSELTHGQEKYVEDIQRATTDLQIAVRRAVGASSPEGTDLIRQIAGIGNAAIKVMLNPPDPKKVKTA